MENSILASPTPLDRFVSPPTINSIGTEAFLRGIETPFIHNGEETTLKKEFVIIFSQMTGNWLQEIRNMMRVFNTGNHILICLPVSTEGIARLLNGTNSITKDDFIDRCSLRDSLTVIPHKRPIEEKTANKEEFLRALDQPYPDGSGAKNLRDKIAKDVANRLVKSETWTAPLTRVLKDHNALFTSAKPLPTSPIGVARCLHRIDSITKEIFSLVTGIEFPKKDINLLTQKQKKDQRAIEKQSQRDTILADKRKQAQIQKDLREENRRQKRIRKAKEVEQKELARQEAQKAQKAALKITLPKRIEFSPPEGSYEFGGVWYNVAHQPLRNQPQAGEY